MKYDYTSAMPTGPNDRWTKRPLIQVEVFGKKDSKKFYALVDSGADYSLFNVQVAELVGLDLSKARNHSFIGIGGSQLISGYFLDEVEIKIEYMDKKIKIPVGFINSDSVSLLLGENGFFDQYHIKFEKDHNTFELNPVKK